jgi:hypothetical protein
VSTRLSPQIRIVALVGVLLIALAGSSLFLLRRSSGSQPQVVLPPQTKTPPAHHSASSSTHSSSSATGKASKAQTSKAHTRAPRQHLNQVDPLLPASLREQLQRHKIVVVSLYDPQAAVDQMSVDEARAGAGDAKAGFALVNVLDNGVAGRLTALLPSGNMLPDPGILVYRAPGKLLYRFDGYLDRAAVAQAAANAKDGLDKAPAAEASAP